MQFDSEWCHYIPSSMSLGFQEGHYPLRHFICRDQLIDYFLARKERVNWIGCGKVWDQSVSSSKLFALSQLRQGTLPSYLSSRMDPVLTREN